MAFTAVLGGGPAYTVAASRTSGGTSPDRSYSGASVTIGRGTNDAGELQAAGWALLANHTGTTPQRPALDDLGNPLQIGFRYLDTTLSKIVVRTASGAWIDGMTGAAA